MGAADCRKEIRAVNLLLALPLLPLVVAAWLALSPRGSELAGGWVVAIVAAFPLATAALVSPQRLELPFVLLQESSALVLDEISRAALFLFGGLWMMVGLLLTRMRDAGRSTTPLLVTLSGAMALALAEGGPLIYAGLLATGYGLYAVMACEPGNDWRRAGRALIVLLVLSDLLVFEILLEATAHPAPDPAPVLLLLGLAALVLRGAIPPAHAWLPPALEASSTPASTLLAAVPAAAALFAVLKALPGGAPDMAALCLALALAGAAWVTLVGIVQVQGRATLGYAVAATATVLLLALPAGAGSGGHLAWLGLAMFACCAALPLVALQRPGWVRDAATAAALVVHGLAAGQATWHAALVLPQWMALLASLAAIMATLLMTLAACRIRVSLPVDAPPETTDLALLPVTLGFIGLAFAWSARPPEFASAWMAPVGISLALTVYRFLPVRPKPLIMPGDLLGPAERAIRYALRLAAVACTRQLPRLVARAQAGLLRLWNGERWSERIQRLDIGLRNWAATGLMMLLFGVGATFLLTR
jgi:NADH:ubiquinone oxidoreductase subunit 2 (subunit N)